MIGVKKLQVFISSTFKDMSRERQCVVETLLEMGHIPAGMELFSADNKQQFEVIKKWIDESDVFLLVLGGRYGSLEPKTGKSYIHLEYQYAKKIGKRPIVILLSDKGIQIKVKQNIYTDEFLAKNYLDFKNSILSNKLCDFFDDVSQLKNAINKAIRNCENNLSTYSGWERGVPRGLTDVMDPGYFEFYSNKLKECVNRGIYDEFMNRIITINPNKTKKVFEIQSTWKFKTVSKLGKQPFFYFDYNSKSKLVFETFRLTCFEINGISYLPSLEGKIKMEQDHKNQRYYCYLEQELPLDNNNAAEVECTYKYNEPFPILSYYTSFMYPARSRNFQINLLGSEDWVLIADAFTSFKNMSTNIHSLYSGKENYIEFKEGKQYSISINEWTLPGTGYYYIVNKKESSI